MVPVWKICWTFCNVGGHVENVGGHLWDIAKFSDIKDMVVSFKKPHELLKKCRRLILVQFNYPQKMNPTLNHYGSFPAPTDFPLTRVRK